MSVTPQVERELTEAYFLFDYDKDGKITGREVGPAVRSVGLNPTESELKDMINDVASIGGKVDVKSLCQIISKRISNPVINPGDLKEAFQVFDRQGNGMGLVSDLKHSLTTLGERLTDEELDELVREVDQDGEGQVNFDEVIRVLLSK